ncbi:MAG: D-aminoacyl-tRNA deacylase [Pyrodictiaceae archaeon]
MKARYAIVFSLADEAGKSIAEKLLALERWRECSLAKPGSKCWYNEEFESILAGFPEDSIYMEFLDDFLEPNAYIFISRHSSSSGEPTLSIHHTGNPTSRAEYGGNPRELSYVLPRLSKKLLLEYWRAAEERGLLGEYSFTLEATHHGPTSLRRPLVFVEIGSGPGQWRDKRAQEAAAQTIMATVGASRLPGCRPAIGIGGTHYPDKHTRIMLESEICYGHIFAKYVLSEFDREVLIQAMEKSLEPVREIIILKVPSKVRRIAEAIAKEKNVEVKIYK